MPGVLGGCGEGGHGHKSGGNFSVCCLAWGDVWGGYFFKFMSGKKSQIFYKGFFCLFFLQASDGHRVGFHILCWLFE